MKRFLLAVAAAFAATGAFAQMQYQTPQPERKIEAPSTSSPGASASPAAAKVSVETPKPKCEDPGAFPGRVGMQTEDRRNRFVKAVETYRNCMVAFVEERKAVVDANQAAARQAIDDLNARIKKINDEQSAAMN